MSLLVVIPYCAKDADLCIGMLEWIGELGGCRRNRCLLITDPKSLSGADKWPDDEKVETIRRLALKNFKSVYQIHTPYRRRRIDGTSEWPMGANWAFYCAALFIGMSIDSPWLLLEPDCVPIGEGWLAALEQEYEGCDKPMMGAVLDTNMPEAHASYLNGTACYPANAMLYFDAAMIDFLNGAGHAFDVAAAARVVPNAHPTRLIQHFWGSDRNTSPTFKSTKPIGDLWNVFTLDALFPEAVLYHRVKDASLINLLRARRNESKLVAA